MGALGRFFSLDTFGQPSPEAPAPLAARTPVADTSDTRWHIDTVDGHDVMWKGTPKHLRVKDDTAGRQYEFSETDGKTNISVADRDGKIITSSYRSMDGNKSAAPDQIELGNARDLLTAIKGTETYQKANSASASQNDTNSTFGTIGGYRCPPVAAKPQCGM